DPAIGCKSATVDLPYTGKKDVNNAGRTCKRWDSRYDSPYKEFQDSHFPDGTKAAAANYCRNPNSKAGGIWCCHCDGCENCNEQGKDWDYCTVPNCIEGNPPPDTTCANLILPSSGSTYCRGYEVQYVAKVTGVTFKGASCEGVDAWVTYERRCDTQPPAILCAHPKPSAWKASYCRGDEIAYMTIVTNVTFIGAICGNANTWTTNELPITSTYWHILLDGVSPVFSYGEKCYFIPIDKSMKSDWLSAETFCSETTNGSIAMPESQDFLDMVNDNALNAGTHNKIWFGPNIIGENYKCAQTQCLKFWKYPHNGTQIPADLFLGGLPDKDKNRLCLFLELNKGNKIANEDCGKSDRIPLCEVNAVHNYPEGCVSEINIQADNRNYTYEYDNTTKPFPRGTIANVTCTVENDTLKCPRTFQAECGGLYGWFFLIGNMSHLEFCEPCRNCSSPPDPTPCTRFQDPEPESILYSHGDTVTYEILGTSGSISINTTCIDGEWEFLAIPEEFMEFDGKCYFLSSDTTDFVDAVKACQEFVGGDLAYPESPDQLNAIKNYSSDQPAHYYMAPHTTNLAYSCGNPTECSAAWTYPNGTNISEALFMTDEPDEAGGCIELFVLEGLRTASCNESKRYVCEINENLNVTMEPGDCVIPPPNTPCGIPIGDIHAAPFKEGESVNYTCPVPGSETQVICVNGTWIGGCEEDPNVFAIGDECYVTLQQKDTIENQTVFCNSLSEGYLAPARSFPSEVIDNLTAILGPDDSFFLGTHLTANPEAYTCKPQNCPSLWLDEKSNTLPVIHMGANKACLLLGKDGLATSQCQGKAFALCRVFTGIKNAKTFFGFEAHCYSISKSSDSLENATMKCEKEFNGYVSPAISSQTFIQLVEEKYNGMNLTGSIIFSTHLTNGIHNSGDNYGQHNSCVNYGQHNRRLNYGQHNRRLNYGQHNRRLNYGQHNRRLNYGQHSACFKCG
ncbi:unnamed protein product, partial [Cyprideis torosa]